MNIKKDGNNMPYVEHACTDCQHTPTPWTISQVEKDYFISANHPTRPGMKYHLATIWEGFEETQAEANAEFIIRAVNEYADTQRLRNSHEELLEALKEAQKIISTARQYFPKSVRNADKFSLENTCASIGKAIAKAEGK